MSLPELQQRLHALQQAMLRRYEGQVIVRGSDGKIVGNVSAGVTPTHGQHIRQALHDWAANKAYLDNKGNYRIKGVYHPSGRATIASWNKAAKREFADVMDLHKAAHSTEYTIQHEPRAKASGKAASLGVATGLAPPKSGSQNLAGQTVKGIYATPSYQQFLDRIAENPRSKIGDGAILAPSPLKTVGRDARAAESARRQANPLYRRLMTKGEVTYTNRANGDRITLRRRYHLDLTLPVYDVFLGANTRPAKDFANLMWSNDRALQFIHDTATE